MLLWSPTHRDGFTCHHWVWLSKTSPSLVLELSCLFFQPDRDVTRALVSSESICRLEGQLIVGARASRGKASSQANAVHCRSLTLRPCSKAAPYAAAASVRSTLISRPALAEQRRGQVDAAAPDGMETSQPAAGAAAGSPPFTAVPAPSASSRLTTEQHPSQLSEPQHGEQKNEKQPKATGGAEFLTQPKESEHEPASHTTTDQPPSEQPTARQPPAHRLKHVQLPGGRGVPVVMQSENGPCPLLAIANVLLLRGNISLPAGASEVTQVAALEAPQPARAGRC